MSAINGMSPEVLASRPPRNMTGDPYETVGSNLATFVFHECYHPSSFTSATMWDKPGCCGEWQGKAGVIKPPPG